MSFTKISDININNDSRSFVIAYNFNAKELSVIKIICNLLGIKDIEILTKSNSNSIIKDIINNKLDHSEKEGLNQKSLIFNNIESIKVSSFIDNMKKFRISRPLIAFVTENNINWTLNTLVSHLLEERNALKSGKTIKH
ncbi:DUF3783 domain-containing protein [Romboutsia lituseburensis]|uniref:DUF3783 domain-containing protein n=1 Tax=Romboutsia lituseburensis DSM 797 TaxID=1121325 RepID=A0A1G9KGG2_9FIRM|nr:DUF3783 domain-containing protein [Romboutsia lituseburensis]CEH34901.1 Domain of unknown function (DUF3783) [Romboutsia lituseburensis]SDL48908.1 protein of unknown function [Romboutsia lituseburensis DSM 797]